MSDPERILAIRLDTIGDVIMTTPALAALADGGAEVTLLTSSYAASLAPMMPYLADVVALDVPWMKPAERDLRPPEAHLETLEGLRARHFDLAVVFTVCTQDPSCAAYLAYLVGVRRVAAYVRGRLYGLVTDPVADPDDFPPRRHEVERQLDLAAFVGYPARDRGLRLRAPSPDGAIRRLLSSVGQVDWCLAHPGATAPSRRYPNEEWSRVIDLLQRLGTRVVLAGGRQDRLRCEEIAALCEREPVRADARLTLSQLAALVRAAPVAITCNSAAAHLSAAVGTPVVTLYAGTNPQHTPWTGRATVLRRPTECTWCLSSACRHARPLCTAIPPSTVVEAVTRAGSPKAPFAASTTHVLRPDTARPRTEFSPGP